MSVKIIIAPVPQFEWKKPISVGLSPTITILPLIPEVRRNMLDAAKRQNASDDVMRVALESEHVIIAGVPMDTSEPATIITASLYTHVVDLALKRFVDVLRLADDAPDCFDRSSWYTANGRPDDKSTPFSLIEPGWRCPTDYARGEHPGLGIVYFLSDPLKSRTADLLRIPELDELFIDL